MRKLFVIFLLLIQFIFSFAYGQETYSNTNNPYKNSQIYSIDTNTHNIISVDFKGYENAILKLNQNQEEVSAFLSKNNNKINNPKYTFSEKYLKIDLYKNFETILPFKFYSKLSCLTNEIYTRAP